MVLNPDGTPNPLPIIDVYGTRRGPKIKRPDPLLEGLASTNPPLLPGETPPPKTKKKSLTGPKRGKHNQPKPMPHPHPQMILDARDLSPKPARSPQYLSSMSNQSSTPPLQKIKEEHSSGDSDSEMRMPINAHHHLNSSNGKVTQLPQAPISPSSIALILQRSNSNGEQAQRKEGGYPHPSGSPNPLEIYNAALNQYLLNPMFHMPNASLNDLLAAQMANEQKTKLLAQLLQSGMIPTTTQQQQNLANDLRNVMTSTTSGGFASANGMVLDLSGTGNTTGVVVEDVKKRNRKGKARRYERRENSEDDNEDDVMMMGMRHASQAHNIQEDDEALDFSNNNNNNSYKDKNKKRKLEVGPTDYSLPSPPLFQNMMCKYCEISFPGRELYSIHMTYHSGDKNPFLCRSCGKKTLDKVEFFKHLATDPH